MIVALFLRIVIMIEVLIKCTLYEDCDYDRGPHKMIVTIFLRIVITIAVLIKCTLYEDCNYDRSPQTKYRASDFL